MQLRLPETVEYDLSVIIVSYNTRDIVLACVQSVLDCKDALSVEIIVVDNCSQDGSVAALRSIFPDIKVIESPANAGFSYGNNIGMEQCHGRYILMLNPDTEVQPAAFTSAISYLEDHPHVGMLGAQISYPDGKPQNSMIRFLSLKTLFFLTFLPSRMVVENPLLGDHRYGSLNADTINHVDCVMGSFMFTRRAVIEEVGGLDHRFFK